MTSLSVCSFPEAPNLAESSSKSRRNFLGSLFSKGGVPFLKGIRRLGKVRAKNTVVHPEDDVLLPLPSATRSVVSTSSSAPHLTAQNSSRPSIDPNAITTGTHDSAAKELKKASRSPYSSSPLGNSVYTASQNTLSSAKEHAIAPSVDVERQRNPFLRALVNLKNLSSTSLVGSSGQSSVPSRTLSPPRKRYNSDTTVTRSSASTVLSSPWSCEGKEAEPVLHIVDTAASESEQAGISSDDLPQESSSDSAPQQPGQRRETAAATTATSTTDKRTSSNEISNSSETPLLVPRFLNVYIAHMRSGSRPLPVSSPSRLPKPSPPTPAAATMIATTSGPNSPRSATASLPDRPTTTREDDNKHEEQEGSSSNEGRARSLRARPSQLPIPVPTVPRSVIANGSEPVAFPAVAVDYTRSHPAETGSNTPFPPQPSFLLTSPTPTERHHPQSPRGRARSQTVSASTTTTTSAVESDHARPRTISASRITATAAELSRGAARSRTISTFSSTAESSSSNRAGRKRTVSGSTTTTTTPAAAGESSSRGTRSRTASAASASASSTAGARNKKKPESSPAVRSSSSIGRLPRTVLESPSFANRELPPSRLPVVVATGKHSG